MTTPFAFLCLVNHSLTFASHQQSVLIVTSTTFVLLLLLKFTVHFASNTGSIMQHTSKLQVFSTLLLTLVLFFLLQPHWPHQRNKNNYYLDDLQTVSAPSFISSSSLHIFFHKYYSNHYLTETAHLAGKK